MKRVAKVVRQRVRRTHKYVGRYVKEHAKIAKHVKHAKRRVRKRHNAEGVKAAMDNVGTTYVEIHNASINNAEIYNAGMTKMTVNKRRGVIN